MRHFLLYLIALSFSLLVSAQVKKPWNDPGYDDKLVHFGFSVGASTADLGIKRTMALDSIGQYLTPDVTSPGFGFQVQIVSNLKLTENLDLRFLPGIFLGSRTLDFYGTIDSTGTYPLKNRAQIEFAILDFPLYFKYRSLRLNNYRPYILGGLNYRYDLASSKEAKKDTHIEFKPGNLYSEFGVGIDYYLPYFKLSTELKIGIGLFESKIRAYSPGWEDEVASIEQIRPYMVGLSFHFE